MPVPAVALARIFAARCAPLAGLRAAVASLLADLLVVLGDLLFALGDLLLVLATVVSSGALFAPLAG